jgi:hypothetical protein
MSLKLPPLQQMPNVNDGPPAFSLFQNSLVKYHVSYALSALAVSMNTGIAMDASAATLLSALLPSLPLPGMEDRTCRGLQQPAL